MATVSIDSVWTFLQSISLSANNMEWLGERLIEAAHAKKAGAKRVRKASAAYRVDDETIEMMVKDNPSPEYSIVSNADAAEIIETNAGQTINPVEKWL